MNRRRRGRRGQEYLLIRDIIRNTISLAREVKRGNSHILIKKVYRLGLTLVLIAFLNILVSSAFNVVSIEDIFGYVQKIQSGQVLAEEEYDRDEWVSNKRFYDKYTGELVGIRDFVLSKSIQGDVNKSFKYSCPYCREELTNKNDIEYDHIVPVYYVWSHGGKNWSREKKTEFYSNAKYGINVCRSCNREKGAKSPDEWLPKLNQKEYVNKFNSICKELELK